MHNTQRTGVAASAPRPHVHRWLRVSGSVGLYHCTNGHECTDCAVCPGCLDSIDVAVNAPYAGLVRYWCPRHASSVAS